MPTGIDSGPRAQVDGKVSGGSPGSAPVLRAIADDLPRGLALRTRLFLGSVLLLVFTIGAAIGFLTLKAQSVADQKIRSDLNAVPAIFGNGATAAARQIGLMKAWPKR